MKQKIKVLILLFLCLIPVIWFVGRPGILIDGSDTNFPLDPIGWFSRRMYVWNANSNAGSDFSASTAGTFFHLVQVIPTLLGFSLQVTEIFSLVFWFSAILLAAYFLAKTLLPKSPLLQVLFASIYAINPYMFNTWENAKVSNISLVLALPIFINLIISLNQKKISLAKGLLLSTFFGLLISGTGINPAYFVVFALTFWICAVIYWKSILKSLAVFAVILAVNAFWILPTAKFVFGNIGAFGGLEKIGYTNWIDSLSRNTSLYNVLRLQGAWDWYEFEFTGQPTYIPYAINYFYRTPFIIFSLLFPAISLLAFVFHDKKNRLNLFFWGIFLVLGVFMSAGTHPPTGTVFRWLLVNHLPFFSLFRSPWYIFTPLIILAYAGLTGIFFDRFQAKFPKLINLAVLIIFFGNLVYCYPLLTGKIFRPTMPDNFYIKFPSYVFDAQKWLKSVEKTLPGRMLSYPPDEIERFKWGYNGIDSILFLLSSVEGLFSPLNAPEFTTASVLRELYYRLGNNDLELAKNLADKMNVSIIFQKNDQKSLFPDLPQSVKQKKIAEFDKWSFYSFPSDRDVNPKIYSPSGLVWGYPFGFGEKLMSLLGKDEILVNPDDSVIKGLNGGRLILAENSQVKDLANYEKIEGTTDSRIVDRNLDQVTFSFPIKEAGEYKPMLERSKLDKYDIDFGMEVEKMTPSYVYFKPIYLEAGKHNLIMNIRQRSLVGGGDFESGEQFKRINEALYKILNEEGNHYLEITNKDKSAPEPAASFTVKDFDPAITYLIKVKYKGIYGNIPQMDVVQSKGDVTFRNQVERFPITPEWQKSSLFFKPVFTDSILKINLVSPFISTAFGTRIHYDDLEVYPLFNNNLLLVKQSKNQLVQPKISFNKVSPVLYEATVKGAKGPHLVVFSENYSPDWEFQSDDIKSPAHFSANMYANAWYVDWSSESYKFKLYYRPQTWRYWGLGVSVVTICAALFYFIYDKNSKKNR